MATPPPAGAGSPGLAAAGPAGGAVRGPSPQQLAAMRRQLAAEAEKRGMTPEEFSNMQRQQIAADAAKQGMTPEQYVNQLRAKAMQQHQQKQQQQQQQQGQGQGQGQSQGQGQQAGKPTPQQQQQHTVPVNSSAPPDPKAVAVAQFLRSQNLKSRTCILDGQRKDMFKVKRALRALQSPAYAKASSKPKSLLPKVTDKESAENAFKLLPLSLLALRVSKTDPHAGHNHAGHSHSKSPQKGRVKGLWTVKIEQHQDTDPMTHYVFLYEGPQWKQKAMAAGALVAIMAVIMFPLWPIMLRQGVWYLSVGLMGLMGLFFAMAIFRLILFCITVFAVPPGLWLYPNLFEDVGFFDSFKPLWGWQEKKKKKKSSKSADAGGKKSSSKAAKSTAKPATAATKPAAGASEPPATDTATTTGSSVTPNPSETVKRDLTPRVEEAEED